MNKKDIFSSGQLAKDLNKSGVEAYAMKSADNILAHLNKSFAQISKKPTIIAVMTSGEFDEIHNKLIDLANQSEGKLGKIRAQIGSPNLAQAPRRVVAKIARVEAATIKA